MGIRVNGCEQSSGAFTSGLSVSSPDTDSTLVVNNTGVIAARAAGGSNPITVTTDANKFQVDLPNSPATKYIEVGTLSGNESIFIDPSGVYLYSWDDASQILAHAGDSAFILLQHGNPTPINSIRLDSNGIAFVSTKIGFFGATPSVKATITGSRALPEQAFKALLTELAAKGIITDSTTV